MIGTTLGPYQIVAKLGEGGMGEVYRATDTKLGRDVALKILPDLFARDPDRLARFEREARTLAALNHPHIAQIYGFEQVAGTSALVMELVEGEDLAQRIARGALALDDALRYALQIADALEHAHGKGIIHRDLKPANVVVTGSGVKLLDFGLAKMTQRCASYLETGATAGFTEPGMILGTPHYMAPEQVERGEADARTDIFAFGCLFYEMLAGRRAFDAGSVAAIIAAVLREQPQTLGLLRAGIPAAVDRIVNRCLEKSPARRFQRVDELRSALSEVRSVRREDERPVVSSIAVLPFVSLSAERESDYFSEGLAEEILTALSHVPRLRVIARTSAFTFRSKEDAIREIGERLNVDTVLEGSVRRAGHRLRVTAQLVHVADQSQLWSERYDRQLTDVFAVQDEIANAIVDRLKVGLGGHARAPLVKRYTENLDAHSLFLKGRFHLHKWRGEEMEAGRTYLEQAIAAEPRHAAALVELAHYHVASAFTLFSAPQEPLGNALALLRQAVGADPACADAHAMLGMLRGLHDHDWSEARRALSLAVSLNPGSSWVHLWQGFVDSAMGRSDEAIEALLRALRLDPLALLNHILLASFYNVRGRHEQAVDHARQALELEPDDWQALAEIGYAYVSRGEYDEGLELLERSLRTGAGPAERWPTGWLAFSYVRAGRRADAERLLQELEQKRQRQYVSAGLVAQAAASLGYIDRAFAWLDTAVRERDTQLLLLQTDPCFAAVRADARYAGLLASLHLEG